jgi:phenylalanyl-tRNA synthetase alpha chain
MKHHVGHQHLISSAIREIYEIFSEMGFSIAEGPLIESEWYNFDALNVPKDHPARDMQDTFFIKDRPETVLRTHTSPVQIRYMEKNKPPIRIIAPGMAFRNEATDATHEVQFHQLEGLAVDTNISLAHLKGALSVFFPKFFGKDIDIRFRPGYFPFVEPGVEVDMLLTSSKGSRWIEVMGAGMVHPNVLRNVNIDSRQYQGFAFGVGIDRLLMVRHEIDDVRLFYSGDLRFVNQF